MQENIVIRGVRQNNLKGFDLTLPRNKLIVFTGLSGLRQILRWRSTRIYAEGQRRYVEIPVLYARQFLGQMDKPDVDAIDGLSPAISIDQKTTSKNPRSTVGTVDGDPRLSAPALRARRRAALPRVRPGNRQADGRSDGRSASRPAGAHPHAALSRRSFAAKRASMSRFSRNVVKQGFVARPHRRGNLRRRRKRPRSPSRTSTTSRSSSIA